MTVGGYHDVAPDIEGGLIHEYVKVTVEPGSFTAEMRGFHPDGSFREVLDSFNRIDPTSVDDDRPILGKLLLNPSSPNPFNPSTTISFTLDADGHQHFPLSLRIFDVEGRQVRKLLDETRHAGTHRVSWDGRDDKGNVLSSGIYLVELESQGIRARSKVTLLK